MEAVRRLDPRVGWDDILMRMEPSPEGRLINKNSLNTQGGRFRKKWKMLSWHVPRTGQSDDQKSRKIVLDSLTSHMRRTNTTRGLTPGLINPAQGEAGGRVPLPALTSGRRRLVPPKGKGDNNKKGKRVYMDIEDDEDDVIIGDMGEDGPDGREYEAGAAVVACEEIRAPVTSMLPHQQQEAGQADQEPQPRRSAVSTAPDFTDTPEGRAIRKELRAAQTQGRKRRKLNVPSQSSSCRESNQLNARVSAPTVRDEEESVVATVERRPSRPSKRRRRSEQKETRLDAAPSHSTATVVMRHENDMPIQTNIVHEGE